MPYRNRRGFTLVELLVVITIIGVLIALLLPAVQAAREAARQAQCRNNMKQLGLALHNYVSIHNVFPPSGLAYGWRYSGGGTAGDAQVLNANGMVLLLPFIEQQTLYDRYNFEQCACDFVNTANGVAMGSPVNSGNAAVAATKLPALMCPSDNGDPLMPSSGAYGIVNAGSSYRGYKTDYDFSVSNAEYGTRNVWKNSSLPTRRAFGENSETTIAMIADGTSNTVAMGERLFNCSDGIVASWGYRPNANCGVDIGYRGLNHWERTWVSTYIPKPGTLGEWHDPGSMHPGGAHLMLADGSVRFFMENTNLTTFQALATIANGQNETLRLQ